MLENKSKAMVMWIEKSSTNSNVSTKHFKYYIFYQFEGIICLINLFLSIFFSNQGKWPLSRNRSWRHYHTSLKIFFGCSPWLHGKQVLY